MKHKIPVFVLLLFVLPGLWLMGREMWTAEKEAARIKVDPIIIDTGWRYSRIYKIRVDNDS